MKHEIILDVLRTIGDKFLQDFKKVPVPVDQDSFYKLFMENEERCLSFIKSRLDVAFPGIPFADGEFSVDEQTKALPFPEFWVCDAMDGAIQYIQHLSGWTINIVLVRNGAPAFAAIYDPSAGEMYWAKAGEGAYLNGVPMQVTVKAPGRFMLAAFDHASSPEKVPGLNQKTGSLVKALLEQFAIVRNYGPHGLQLASVAAGRIDIFCEEGLDTYNWLPGLLIAKEAGAEISTIDGRPWTWGEHSIFVAAPGVVERFKNA